jgi:hypothetical protein
MMTLDEAIRDLDPSSIFRFLDVSPTIDGRDPMSANPPLPCPAPRPVITSGPVR